MAKTAKGHGRKASASRAAGGGRPTSLVAVRASRAVEALAGEFVRWFEPEFGTAEEALACIEVVSQVAAAYFERTGATAATALEPGPLAELLDELAEEADDEVMPVVVEDMLHHYVDFLYDTGHWSGTDDDYEGVHALFAEGDELAGEDPVIHVPALAEDQQAEAFAALPLIQRARALLDWLGRGRPVTQTGALRVADLEAAAACVGLKARGVRKRSTEALEAAGAEGYVLAQSMRDLPALSRMWEALAGSGLIQIRSTKAVPLADAGLFLDGPAADRLELSRELVTEYLYQTVIPDDEPTPWEAGVAATTVGFLIAAASPQPPLLERVLAVQDNMPGVDSGMASFAAHGALANLWGLADLGLLTADDRLTLAPVVAQCVAEAFAGEYGIPVEHAEGEHPGGADDGATRARAVVPQSVFQLKVLLKGSKPPVWRRVLVPSDLRLDGLHRVIQAVFAWGDFHLHEFRKGGWGGTGYGPAEAGIDDEDVVDEATVRVSDVLAAAGEKLVYTYDFGDDWKHEISLEAVREHDGGPLPRVEAGRGASPVEDSGGVWGWADIVEAANNPADERHAEMREWLGLPPGATVDPKAFSVEEANEDLQHLR